MAMTETGFQEILKKLELWRAADPKNRDFRKAMHFGSGPVLAKELKIPLSELDEFLARQNSAMGFVGANHGATANESDDYIILGWS